jgi:hypothetical protein
MSAEVGIDSDRGSDRWMLSSRCPEHGRTARCVRPVGQGRQGGGPARGSKVKTRDCPLRVIAEGQCAHSAVSRVRTHQARPH